MKKYIIPTIQVMNMKSAPHLLSGSLKSVSGAEDLETGSSWSTGDANSRKSEDFWDFE